MHNSPFLIELKVSLKQYTPLIVPPVVCPSTLTKLEPQKIGLVVTSFGIITTDKESPQPFAAIATP